MKRINILRAGVEFCVTALLLWIFPFVFERKLKLFVLYVFCQLILGRFRNKSTLIWDELRRILLAYSAFLMCALLLIPYKSYDWLWQVWLVLAFTVVDLACTVIINRYVHVLFYKLCKENTLIIGIGDTANRLASVIRRNRFSMLDIMGFVNCNGDPYLPTVHQEDKITIKRKKIIPWYDMKEFIAKNKINTVLIAIPEMTPEELSHLSSLLGQQVSTVKYLPISDSLVNYASQVEDFDGMLMISTSEGKINPAERVVKRIIDICGGIAGCLILIPLTGYVYVLNRKQGDTDPIFFSQDRIGADGKLFKCYKFRTMVPGAEDILQELLNSNPEMAEEYRINKKLENDPRITKAGQFLRRTSLDEFPQFLNVLKGDMSLIGPRPYLPGEIPDMGDTYYDVIGVAPGITGMWQTHGRSNVTFAYRLVLDEFYCRNWTLWLDMTILVKTIQGLFAHDDAM